MSWVFAHQGGWDETVLVLAPVAVLGVLLKLADRRAKSRLAAMAPTPPEHSTDGEPAGPTEIG